MKRKEMISTLLKEGMKRDTLSVLNDKQILTLYTKLIGEATIEVKDPKNLENIKKFSKPDDKIIVDPDLEEKQQDMQEKETELEEKKYPWDKCIKDQKKKYGKESAKKICGSIKAKSQNESKESCKKCGKLICECGKNQKKSKLEEAIISLVEKNLVSLASKKDIMEMIQRKMNETNAPTIAPTKPITKPTTKPGEVKPKNPYQPSPGVNPKPKAENKDNLNKLPEFLTFDAIFGHKEAPTIAPSKPKTMPKPGVAPKPKNPYQPSPGVNPKPKASLKETIKKKLNHLQTLDEMPMHFENPDEIKPNPDLQNSLSQQDTPLKKIPFPKSSNQNQNFLELLASERYKDVLDRVKSFTGLNRIRPTANEMQTLQSTFMTATHKVVEVEARHKPALEKLAVELVKKEMNIPEGAIIFDAKIISPGTINNDHENSSDDMDDMNPDEFNTDDIELEEKLYNRIKDFNLERAKRRLINATVQGASKRGHYMFSMVNNELRQITGNDDLLNSYGIMMSVNDLLYWIMPEAQMFGMAGSGEVHGSEEIDRNSVPPKVIARGFSFPVLVHELIKGVMEIFAVNGLPENHLTSEKVMELEDVLEKEVWDLRIGPQIWARLRAAYPEDILTDENKMELQNFLFIEFVKLPAREFLYFYREIMVGSPKGRKLLQDLTNEITERLNKPDDEDYDYGESIFRRDLNDMSEEMTDEELQQLISGLGIHNGDAAPKPTEQPKPEPETPPQEDTDKEEDDEWDPNLGTEVIDQ